MVGTSRRAGFGCLTVETLAVGCVFRIRDLPATPNRSRRLKQSRNPMHATPAQTPSGATSVLNSANPVLGPETSTLSPATIVSTTLPKVRSLLAYSRFHPSSAVRPPRAGQWTSVEPTYCAHECRWIRSKESWRSSGNVHDLHRITHDPAGSNGCTPGTQLRLGQLAIGGCPVRTGFLVDLFEYQSIPLGGWVMPDRAGRVD